MVTNITGIAQLITAISQIKTPSFVRIINYSNDKGEGEIANYTINLGINYNNAKVSDIQFLREEKNLYSIDFGSKNIAELATLARIEMLQSRLKPGAQSRAQSEAYETLCPNVRLHTGKQRIYIYGFVVRKDVVKVGNYKHVDSAPLTLAKRKIEEQLKATQFRQFAFDKLKSVKVKGEEIEITIQ
jgi:hypothetical protein